MLQAQHARDPASVLAALDTYYSVQTSIRGYAVLDQQVLNNTGWGAVANRELATAIGEANYTPEYRANFALQLASKDFNTAAPVAATLPPAQPPPEYALAAAH